MRAPVITYRLPDIGDMYSKMARRLPNFVTCETCGRRQDVNPAECLQHGWPKCCQLTMTLGERRLR